MTEFIKLFLKIVNIASLICGFPIVIFVYFCEFFGYDKGNEVLKNINFPLDDNGLIIIGYICAVLFVVSLLLRKKFFN